MELTQDELMALSDYFNRQTSLPNGVKEVAKKMKELLNPTVKEETVVEKIVKKVTKKK